MSAVVALHAYGLVRDFLPSPSPKIVMVMQPPQILTTWACHLAPHLFLSFAVAIHGGFHCSSVSYKVVG